MRIELSKNFVTKLSRIVAFIALDSPNRAKAFKTALITDLRKIQEFPYSYRKSIYFESDNIRDFIFKGYLIPFKIYPEKNLIFVIGITKYDDKLN